MASATERERIRALEAFQSVHEKRLDELKSQLDTVAFYIKGIAYMAGLMAYHVVGGPYAQALGDMLGQLH